MSLLRPITSGPAAAPPPRRERELLDPLERRILRVVAESLCRIEEELELGDLLVEDLRMDSLDYVELVLALEREFVVQIRDEEALRLCTVRDVIEYIGSKTLPETSRAA